MIKKLVIYCILTVVMSSAMYAKQSTKVNAKTDYKVTVVPKKMSVQTKKQRFRDLVVPVVIKVYADLEAQYQEAKEIIDSGKTDIKIEKYMSTYGTKNPNELLKRMKPHAKSIAIAQAAMESAWATSRFTRVAKNLFGVWSFKSREPRVAAGVRRGDKTIYVRKYESIEESVRDYYKVLATKPAFTSFRTEKMKSNNPYKLAKNLDKYSEKGALYGKELTSMIKYNRFYKFD